MELAADSIPSKLRQVPASLGRTAEATAPVVQKTKASYSGLGFADQTGAIVVQDAERAANTLKDAAAKASDTLENIDRALPKDTLQILASGSIEGEVPEGSIFRSGSWEIHSGNIQKNHRSSKVGTAAL